VVRSRRRTARRFALTVVVVGALAVVGTGVAAWQLGPRVGLWVVPPSPARYGQDAVRQMDAGLYAHGAAWDAARRTALEELRSVTSFDEADEVLRVAVAVAGGHHSTVLPDREPDAEVTDPPAPTVEVHDGVATAAVPEFTGDAAAGRRYAETIADGLAASGACGVVVDLRGNGGGDLGPMLAGLAPLLPEGVLGSFVIGDTVTDLRLDGGRFTGGGTPTSTDSGATALRVPVAVLTDGGTGSSGEQVVLAFRGLDAVRTFGEPTAGYASVNRSSTLFSGSTLVLTVGETRARTGEVFGDQPIPPDEATAVADAPAGAARWLAAQGCGGSA
jgi:carboxyl-terminal processing protease